MDNINWISMALATLLPIVLGYFFYRKSIASWMSTTTQDGKGRGWRLLMGALLALILSFFLSWFMVEFTNGGIHQESEFDTFGHGAWHGMFMSVVVVAPIIVNQWLFQTNSVEDGPGELPFLACYSCPHGRDPGRHESLEEYPYA